MQEINVNVGFQNLDLFRSDKAIVVAVGHKPTWPPVSISDYGTQYNKVCLQAAAKSTRNHVHYPRET